MPLATFPYSQTADGRVQRTLAICPGLDFDALVSAAVGTASTSGPAASQADEPSRSPATNRETMLSMIRSVSIRSSFKLGSLPIPLEEGTPSMLLPSTSCLKKSDIRMNSARADAASNHRHMSAQFPMQVALAY